MKNLYEIINHHESFKSDILGLYKKFCSIITRHKRKISHINDKNFEKIYGFKKEDRRSDDLKLTMWICTENFGKSVAEMHGIKERQLKSIGYNYSTFGYEIAKIYINDPDFHNGVYDSDIDRIVFCNIDCSARKGGFSYYNAHKGL
jgi:hypothetical protein